MKTRHAVSVTAMSAALLFSLSFHAEGREVITEREVADPSLMRDIRTEFSSDPQDHDRPSPEVVPARDVSKRVSTPEGATSDRERDMSPGSVLTKGRHPVTYRGTGERKPLR